LDKIRAIIKITGTVQGVGFRPFVYRIANQFNCGGFVNNDMSGVIIDIDIENAKLKSFLNALMNKAPILAKIDDIVYQISNSLDRKEFLIKKSDVTDLPSVSISPDIAVCDKCLEEMFNPHNRRYHYFFINCTECGPRYTITKRLPYDRKNTSMDKFEMCFWCEREYYEPINRRYHAQPISCFDCSPKLFLKDAGANVLEEGVCAIEKTASLLKKGKIVALKGLGGFHLLCDATNSKAVKALRERKRRALKPFAVMFKNINWIKSITVITEKEKEFILSKEKPIVLVKKKKLHRLDKTKFKLSASVAPNIDRLGVFLPYTPIHYLLFEYIDFPIVATSANVSDEPIIKDFEDLKVKLRGVFDFVLDHERDIVNACDDSVVQEVNGEKQILRLSRGYAPLSFHLPFKVKKRFLAVGARQKNAIALAFEDKIILSPHIGDLGSVESFEYFKRTINVFKNFYNFEPQTIVCDKHPSYETSEYARNLSKSENLDLIEVQHHLSHVYAAKAEMFFKDHPLKDEKFISFSWDGTGYGDDGTIWGGEVFVGDERKYHFKYFKLLGGEKAIKEPRRVALGMLFSIFKEKVFSLEIPPVEAFSKGELKLLYDSFQKDINTPLTSSVGRLFDAVASVADLVQVSGYEGHTGLLIEKFYSSKIEERYSFEIRGKEIVLDEAFKEMLEDLKKVDRKKRISTKFINTLADIVIFLAKKENLPVILCGGVFQNKTLLNILVKKFKKENISYFFPTLIPINDGGIALGQLWKAIKG